MSKYHMGINMGHDRSAAIVKDGEIIVAIEQERLDRNKHSVGYMLQAPTESNVQVPIEAMGYCLDSCGITLMELDSITPNMPGNDLAPNIIKKKFLKYINKKVAKIPSHHLAHAYSAFWPSGFDEAIILVVDASGSTDENHCTESYTLYEGHENIITTIHSEKVASHFASLSTLGFIYEYITRKAGFITKVGTSLHIPEAGKLMGLAPYGGQQRNFHRWIHTQKDSYHLSISPYDIFLEVAAIEKRYDTGKGKPYYRPYLVDLAYKIQHELAEALIHIIRHAIKQTGLKKLCIAGGVGLNSVANYKIFYELNLDDIFIFPAAGDSGIAAGCALWAFHNIEGGIKRTKLHATAFGKKYNDKEIDDYIMKYKPSIEAYKLTPNEIIERTAQALSAGHIVARFDSGSEYGPRALGHRSIIADPTFKRMKDVLNVRVKHREAFRPFAPVIPLEDVCKIFELDVESPYMLLVSKIKPEFQQQIPAVTHEDGTGRVQTVTEKENPYFYNLCHKLVELRQGPPVLLNTSFNIAGQPIVETPEEAIKTFLLTDIDYLCLENFWIVKKNIPVQSYEENINRTEIKNKPHGMPPDQPSLDDLMEKLDKALFFGVTIGCPWSFDELRKLSSEGALYKETSVLFPHNPFYNFFSTRLSSNVVILIDPLGKSRLINLNNSSIQQSMYTFEEIKLLIAIANAKDDRLEKMRLEMRLTNLEFDQKVEWAIKQLSEYGIEINNKCLKPMALDTELTYSSEQTFNAFENEEFSARQSLIAFNNCLKKIGYKNDAITSLLQIKSNQEIDPTYIYYYDKFLLPKTILADLIRLFQLRSSLPKRRLQEIFSDKLFITLSSLGVLIPRGENWASRIDLFNVADLYLATDHRFMFLEEDQINEDPVMYIGMDSIGLANSAPQFMANQVLDLCCGSGIQGLIASRYSKNVSAVDLNPRCIRFCRFNAQLNGIRNIHFYLGNLYEPVNNRKFNTILANPPFVPSPKSSYRYRDGGSGGEELLSLIIKGSADHLTEDGKLFIVTDLVDIQNYEQKLKNWWTGGTSHNLILKTADRNDILFSIPHSHAPFGQTFEDYNEELGQWLNNLHKEGITYVNFGYIFIYRIPQGNIGSFYIRTIHNPISPIHNEIKNYFYNRDLLDNKKGNKFIILSKDINFRTETDHNNTFSNIEIFSYNSQYFTTYKINDQIYRMLQDINTMQPQLDEYITKSNKKLVYDLIYKGILCLSDERLKINKKDQVKNQPIWTNVKEIQELETKTTPTCLSSYLSQ